MNTENKSIDYKAVIESTLDKIETLEGQKFTIDQAVKIREIHGFMLFFDEIVDSEGFNMQLFFERMQFDNAVKFIEEMVKYSRTSKEMFN